MCCSDNFLTCWLNEKDHCKMYVHFNKKNGACKTLQTGHNIIHCQKQIFLNIKISSLHTYIGLQNSDFVAHVLHTVLFIGITFYIVCSWTFICIDVCTWSVYSISSKANYEINWPQLRNKDSLSIMRWYVWSGCDQITKAQRALWWTWSRTNVPIIIITSS